MADYGFKISKDGHDVKTADHEDLIFSSKYPFLKAFAQGSFSLTITGPGVYVASINHNLGYPAKFVHFISVDPNTTAERYLGRFSASHPSGDINADSYEDLNTLNIAWEDTSAAPGVFKAYPYTIYGYYYLFYDSIT